jgi:phosphate transport system protein
MGYVETIKKKLIEMWLLVNTQISKSCRAVADFDQDLAREIVLIEERVNSYEFLIDSDCQIFRSLHPDQNNHLSFLMTALKTNRHLERLGDIAADIANEIIITPRRYKEKLLADTRLIIAYGSTIKMLEITLKAFRQEDVELARLVLKRSKYLEGFTVDINTKIKSYIKENPDDIESVVHILSIVRYMERMIEHAGCLANGIITYVKTLSQEPVTT